MSERSYAERVQSECSANGIGGNRAAELWTVGACADAEIAALKAERDEARAAADEASTQLFEALERTAELGAFAAYAYEYSNDPPIVKRARALLGEGGQVDG